MNCTANVAHANIRQGALLLGGSGGCLPHFKIDIDIEFFLESKNNLDHVDGFRAEVAKLLSIFQMVDREPQPFRYYRLNFVPEVHMLISKCIMHFGSGNLISEPGLTSWFTSSVNPHLKFGLEFCRKKWNQTFPMTDCLR